MQDVIGHDKKGATLQVSFEFIAVEGSRAPPASSSMTKPNLNLPVSAISAKGIKVYFFPPRPLFFFGKNFFEGEKKVSVTA